MDPIKKEEKKWEYYQHRSKVSVILNLLIFWGFEVQWSPASRIVFYLHIYNFFCVEYNVCCYYNFLIVISFSCTAQGLFWPLLVVSQKDKFQFQLSWFVYEYTVQIFLPSLLLHSGLMFAWSKHRWCRLQVAELLACCSKLKTDWCILYQIRIVALQCWFVTLL